MEFIYSFLFGGLICLIGQILIDLTKLTPARIMVIFVTSGVLLGALGIYDNLVNLAGCGATVPLSGFGNLLASGVKKAIDEKGFLGIFTGALTSSSAGICAALIFAFIASVISKPKSKS